MVYMVSGDGIISVIWYMRSSYFSEIEREEAAVAGTLSRSEGGSTGGVPRT